MFFKPTVLYKEFMILDLIEKDSNITQRSISDAIGVAVSMVNSYLDEYESKGYIIRKYRSTKTVEYFVTSTGLERRKLLNIWYLKSSHKVFISAKDNIMTFLNQVFERGYKKILLYGAGEVGQIILHTINEDNTLPLEILGVIDDDKTKWGQRLFGKLIIAPTELENYEHDGIFISSYQHHSSIVNKLKQINYPKKNIIEFFE